MKWKRKSVTNAEEYCKKKIVTPVRTIKDFHYRNETHQCRRCTIGKEILGMQNAVKNCFENTGQIENMFYVIPFDGEQSQM